MAKKKKSRSSKGLYSICFADMMMTKETVEKVQHDLFEMLLDIKTVCDENNIDYILIDGTLLGAVRHHGFIPWDDDIDLGMLRSEYLRFADAFRKKFGDKYIIGEPLDKDYVFKAVKIFKPGTKFVEIPYAGLNKYDMLFIDIFLIERVPAPGFAHKMKGKLYNLCYKASSVCVDYKYPSPPIMERAKDNEELADYYRTRRRLGSFFSHVGGMRFYIKMCERLADQKKETGWYGRPSDEGYFYENYEAHYYTELTTMEFCGAEFKIPAAYDEFLTRMYGNYMRVPDEKDRKYHIAYKVEL